jgi:hypothetical protein
MRLSMHGCILHTRTRDLAVVNQSVDARCWHWTWFTIAKFVILCSSLSCAISQMENFKILTYILKKSKNIIFIFKKLKFFKFNTISHAPQISSWGQTSKITKTQPHKLFEISQNFYLHIVPRMNSKQHSERVQ